MDSMSWLSFTDYLLLILVCSGITVHFIRKQMKGFFKPTTTTRLITKDNQNSASSIIRTRDISKNLAQYEKDCVIFYGSHTGTAEKIAFQLAKEGASRFGLKTMVADLDDFDYDKFDTFPSNKVAMFVVATYGDGEPTDNAISFTNFISNPPAAFTNRNADLPLQNFSFVAFGLGNSTYQNYNSMVDKVDDALNRLGAQRIGPVGKGDDAKGSIEEDFATWKESMWTELAKKMSLVETEQVYQPVFNIVEESSQQVKSDRVFLGEPNKAQLAGKFKGPYSSQNPFAATIAETRELFTHEGRNCLHIDFDVSQSTIEYDTGDHVAVWPMNSDIEVERFLRVFGLLEKREIVLSISSNDPTYKVPIPALTTYEASVRYYLEICAPVSRRMLSYLALLVSDKSLQAKLSYLSTDKAYFSEAVAEKNLNIAQAIQLVSGPGQPISIPFSFLLENLNKLRPRYYSISSSSLVQKKKISITAVVESNVHPQSEFVLKGVSTNYLLALHNNQNQAVSPTYQISGPRNRYGGAKVLLHTRASKFKLPTNPAIPVIMIGPGTGVAPFRAFVQERAMLQKMGKDVGRTLLFFGCRRSDEDFIYQNEWAQYKAVLGDSFDLVVAFSRESSAKVYVQHKIKEHAAEVGQMLLAGAHIYVCGDASKMAKDVNSVFEEILGSQSQNIQNNDGKSLLKEMRTQGRYLEDVWS